MTNKKPVDAIFDFDGTIITQGIYKHKSIT